MTNQTNQQSEINPKINSKNSIEGKNEFVLPIRTKIAAWIAIIGGIILFGFSIYIGFFLSIVMADMATAYNAYSFVSVGFFSSILLIPFGIFLLIFKRKKWVKWIWRSIVVLILFLISFLVSPLAFLFLNIHSGVIFPFIVSFSIILIFLLWDRKYYCQIISEEGCKKEAFISFISGVISIICFIVAIILMVIISIKTEKLGGYTLPKLLSLTTSFLTMIIPLSSLLGLVFGILGLSSTKKKFAKIGIGLSITGLVVIIFLILSSISMSL